MTLFCTLHRSWNLLFNSVDPGRHAAYALLTLLHWVKQEAPSFISRIFHLFRCSLIEHIAVAVINHQFIVHNSSIIIFFSRFSNVHCCSTLIKCYMARVHVQTSTYKNEVQKHSAVPSDNSIIFKYRGAPTVSKMRITC